MNKYAAWYWDGEGPLPTKLGYKQVNMVSESPSFDLDDHRRRVREVAGELNDGEPLVINVEKYGRDNVPYAILLAHETRSANPTIFVGCYVTQANGDRWGICGKTNAPRDNVLAVDAVHVALSELAPWVDFFTVDLFNAETSADVPVAFNGLTADATWELIAATRVAIVEGYGKPWWGCMGVKAIPGKSKPIGTTIDKNTLYAQAAWCKAKGADGLLMLVWDDARKRVELTGKVANTPDITQALNAIGKL